ncbi:MAG: hypothetical protein XD89_0640 [Anaerolineae bacterium 49_20]|nr:MAG: hypothetical protein XD89_0640 [Anaerolineae bacterium 49_20]
MQQVNKMTEATTNANKKSLSANQVQIIVIVVFLFGLCLRLIGLGALSFSVEESQTAWQALQVARDLPAETASNAVYQGLTAVTLAVMQANTFWARFWPALAGASLALVPLFWRRRMTPFLTIGLALVLALDPVLFILSRQIGSAIFVLAGLAWALTFFFAGKPVGVGVATAVALLGGSWIWAIMFIVLIALGLAYLINKVALKQFAESLLNVCPIRRSPVKFVLGFVITLLALATSFGLDPSGLSGIAGGLVAFTHQGFATSLVPAWVQLYRWAAYSICPLILALAAAVHAWREYAKGKQALSILIVVFLIGAVLFANLGPSGLVFVQIPLWILALSEVERLVKIKPEQPWVSRLVFIFSLVMCVYLAISWKSFLSAFPGTLAFSQQGLAFGLGLVLLGLIYLFSGLGWSFQAAGKGVASAITLVLLVSTLSLTFSSTVIKAKNAALIWSDTPVLDSTDEIAKVLHEFERLNTFEAETASVAILDPNLAGYAWFFNQFGQVRMPLVLPEGESPEVILSHPDWQLSPDQPYRGMDFIASRQINWATLPPIDLVNSAFNQTFTTEPAMAILWIRQDLFTGANP